MTIGKTFLAFTQQRIISQFEHLIYEYLVLHILHQPCFSWKCGESSTMPKRISSLGKGTAGGLHFLFGSLSDEFIKCFSCQAQTLHY